MVSGQWGLTDDEIINMLVEQRYHEEEEEKQILIRIFMLGADVERCVGANKMFKNICSVKKGWPKDGFGIFQLMLNE